MEIKHLIFDFDGTLVDTAALIVATLQQTARRLDLPPRDEAACRSVIGLRLEEIGTALWPQTADPLPLNQRFAAGYRQIFEELKGSYRVSCFPGVEATLHRLHAAGYGMAIASSRSHRSLADYVAAFGLGACFEMVVGGDDVAHGKPAPDPVLKILEAQQWAPQQTLVVGDMAVDIQMGRRAGCHTCGVTYGNGTGQELRAAKADRLLAAFPRLEALLA